MSDDRMTRSLLWANLCSERISRALRQHDRLQKAYKRLQREQERVFADHQGGGSVAMPQSYGDLHAVYDDHLYFFVLSTRQALKAAWVLEQRGEAMPTFRQGDKLRAWRDFEEHWDAEGRGKTSDARETWQTHSDDEEPGLTTRGVGHRLRNVSGVSLRKLRKDLERARDAAFAIGDREWRYCYITAAEAAEILGMTDEEFEAMPMQPLHHDFGHVAPEPPTVRYWREWVEARRDGHLVPPGWENYVAWSDDEQAED